LILCKKNSSF